MPKTQKQKNVQSAVKPEENGSGSPQSSIQSNSPLRDETPIIPRGKKRSMEQDGEDHAEEFGQGLQKMLECFGSDYIKNSLMNKKKRLEQLTQGALKASSKTVDDIWRVQTSERTRLQDEYSKQVSAVFQQWESDLEKTKEQEAKLTMLYKQQQKLFEQARAVQSQRLKTIKQLHCQYIKGLDDLEKTHHHQATSATAELKKEMSLLQKKILMDTTCTSPRVEINPNLTSLSSNKFVQQQEMANVRKSLQTMLF